MNRRIQRQALAAVALSLAAVFGVASAASAAPGTNPIPDPESGVKLATRTATLPADAPQLDLTKSAGWFNSGNLNEDENCALSGAQALDPTSAPASAPVDETAPATEDGSSAPTDETGPATEDGSSAPTDEVLTPAVSALNDSEFRVYSTLEITIVKSGVYTFRVVDSTLGPDADNPFGDPYLALYTTFDLNNLDSGVVGCNDDGGLDQDADDNDIEGGVYFPGYETKEYNSLYPIFSSQLEPGKYTLVLMTYSAVTAAQWQAENLGPQSVIFEYWGPECGVEGGTCALAQTGVDTSGYLAAAAALLLAGAGALVVARRRAVPVA